jgi:amidohydrolase
MSSWLTTARIMASTRPRWHGTLVMMAQPAEETGQGAAWMITDGLLTRFPKPDFALAIHDDARYPAGTVGYHAGATLSNSDTVRITIYGRGGHGARPETTIDPVVIAARTVLTLQTIVAREISPLDSAVITVGSIHAGTRANIIPDEAKLELSVRSLTDAVRTHLLDAITRIAKAEAAAAGAPKEPLIEHVSGTPALINDPALTRRIGDALTRELGADRVRDLPPEMVSEDFSALHRNGVPALMLRIGAVEPSKFEAATKSGAPLPSLHSPLFAPDRERTIKAAVAAEVLSLRELLRVP